MVKNLGKIPELCPMNEEEADGRAYRLLESLANGRGETINREDQTGDVNLVRTELLKVAELSAEKVRAHYEARARQLGDDAVADEMRRSGPIRLTECC